MLSIRNQQIYLLTCQKIAVNEFKNYMAGEGDNMELHIIWNPPHITRLAAISKFISKLLLIVINKYCSGIKCLSCATHDLYIDRRILKVLFRKSFVKAFRRICGQ